MSVPVKLLLSCNIKPGIEEAKIAFAYLTQEFPTSMREAGLELSDAWYTVYGTWPQIRMSFICQEAAELQSFLHSDTWQALKRRLMNHIQEYKQKVVLSRDHFQF